MIPVSTSFRDRWRSGHFKLDRKVELYLPANPTAISATSESSADYPASAMLDGDRTELNAGPNNGLYPPPAGPENFIGRGMWKSASNPSVGSPQRITLTIGTGLVGVIRIYTHPTDGGITAFSLATKATSVASEVPIAATSIRRARAWEQYNGRSTVAVDTAGGVTVTATNTYRVSIPSVIEIVLDANVSGADATGQLVVIVTAAGSASGKAQCCEIETFRLFDVESRVWDLEVSHGADVRNRSMTAREFRATISNRPESAGEINFERALTVADFLRPATGQAAVDLRPELAIFFGIDNELVQVGSMAIDNADFDYIARTIQLTGRGRTERALFERPVAAWRRNADLDDACLLAWELANNPGGLTVLDRNPTTIDPFMPGDKGWDELQALRQTAQDRGTFVDGEGVLRFVNNGTVAGGLLLSICTPHTEIYSTIASAEFRGQVIPNDMLWFDPANGFRLYFQERTVQTYKSPPFPSSDPVNLDDRDDDRLTHWNMRAAFSTRASLQRVLDAAATAGGSSSQADVQAVPLVMARRPGTDDYYFFTSSADPNANNQTPPPFRIRGWRIQDGAITSILAAQTLGGFVVAAAFIGTVLYWWEAPHANGQSDGDGMRLHTLKKWDVTTAYAPITVATETARDIRTMISIGPWLLWSQHPGFYSQGYYGGSSTGYQNGTCVEMWLTTQPWNNRTLFIGQSGQLLRARRLLADGTDPNTARVWGVGGGDGTALSNYLFRRTLLPVPFLPSSPAPIADASTLIPNGGQCFGAITLYEGGLLFVSNEGGRAVLRWWDGVNGSTTKILGYGGSQVHTSPGAVSGPNGVFTALAVSPVLWYGRQPIVALESGTSQSGAAMPTGRLFFWLIQKTVPPPDETVPGEILSEVVDKASYEIGGAIGGAHAIDMTVHDRVVTNGESLLAGGGLSVASSHFVKLDDTADPLTLSPAPVRRHARFPRYAGAPDVLGTTGIDESRIVRQVRTGAPTDDPALFAVDTMDVKWISDDGVAIMVADAVLRETAPGTRLLTCTAPLAPHVETGDVLTFTLRNEANEAPIDVTAKFRLIHMTHHNSVDEATAEARTTWELVLVPDLT